MNALRRAEWAAKIARDALTDCPKDAPAEVRAELERRHADARKQFASAFFGRRHGDRA